VESFFVPWYY